MNVTSNQLKFTGKPWQIRIMLKQTQKQWGSQITVKQLIAALGQNRPSQ